MKTMNLYENIKITSVVTAAWKLDIVEVRRRTEDSRMVKRMFRWKWEEKED